MEVLWVACVFVGVWVVVYSVVLLFVVLECCWFLGFGVSVGVLFLLSGTLGVGVLRFALVFS